MATDDPATPILVWSDDLYGYDFGPSHPLTPRRFGPGIGLLRATGADRLLAPPIADDVALGRLHDDRYIADVRATSMLPERPLAAGVGTGDVPAFAGMHEASARVAGGSIAGTEAILDGRTDHAFNPGGGLHHAMAGRASGFCVYNDVALACAAAADAGHRVLYVDLDVHHGDGTQALFWDDPRVLTLSVHESGRMLFPGTGAVTERGGDAARGTAVNVPLEAGSGDDAWWPVVETMLPALAGAFAPTFLVSQHGCDSHAWDPLAHLRVTTASYAKATRLLDELAHEHCDGRWLATGGGGYDAYRVVPRSWALVGLAQSHRPVPDVMPAAWRESWAAEAERHGQGPLPEAFIDPAGTVAPDPPELIEHARGMADLALERARAALARH